MNCWSRVTEPGRRSAGGAAGVELSTPSPVHDRWFVDGSPVPIRLPFARLEDLVRRPVYSPVRECFFHFSSESVRKLKEKANAEMSGVSVTATTISSLHARRSGRPPTSSS
ncbi:hypothetical protein HU200_028421 [Digitaria exilis]|uniref:Uncharacterized protein n=1 Tax=Digitaria exilis TaxID=1010633 RepID=A0A835EVH8_9POAL|nr:hypothetical protein HU200_028421 [Digitaria exilis]